MFVKMTLIVQMLETIVLEACSREDVTPICIHVNIVLSFSLHTASKINLVPKLMFDTITIKMHLK